MLCHSPERLQGFASWSTAASQPQPCSPGLFPASLGVTQDTSGVRQGPGRAGLSLHGALWVPLRPWVCSTSSPMPPHPAQESPHSPGADGDAAGGGSLSLGLPAVTAGARSCPQQEHKATCMGTHRPQPRREGRPGRGIGKNLVPGARALPARAALLSPLGTSRAGGRGAVRWQCHQARRGQAGRARLCCSSSQHRQPPAALSGSGGWTPGQVSRRHFSPHAERRWRCFTARAGAWGPSPALCSPWGRGVEVWLFPWLCHGAVLPLLGARRSGQGAAPGQRAEAGHGAGHGARPRPPSSSRRGERAVSAAG